MADDLDLPLGCFKNGLECTGALVLAVEQDTANHFFEYAEYSIGAWGSLIATPQRKSVRARS